LDLTERIAAIRAGDTEQFEAVVEIWQQPIFRYCLHMLGNRQDAEDAAQDVFIKAFEKLHQFRYASSFQAWLYKIACNHCINLLGKRKTRSALVRALGSFTAETDNAHKSDGDELSPEIRQAVSKLSAEEKNLLILRAIEDKPFDEIAEIMGKNAAALRKKFERLKRKMQKSMEMQGENRHEKFSVI
jgi:RNA polymerase sigma factor (sigma-70 family)